MLEKIEKGVNYQKLHKELREKKKLLIHSMTNHILSNDELMKYNEINHDLKFIETFFYNCKLRRKMIQKAKQRQRKKQ